MHYIKSILFILSAIIATTIIGWIFWEHEIKYAAPTRIPSGFQDVPIGSVVNLSPFSIVPEKVTVLHFYNPECPCSKFNMKDFENLTRKYTGSASFIVILQSEDEDAVVEFNRKYKLKLPVIADTKGVLSDICGIYSTPQAVVIDKNSIVYYKGNYNKSRFCTRKQTRYVEIALDSLIADQPLPLFIRNELTVPYGCNLPSDEVEQKPTITFFKHRYTRYE